MHFRPSSPNVYTAVLDLNFICCIYAVRCGHLPASSLWLNKEGAADWLMSSVTVYLCMFVVSIFVCSTPDQTIFILHGTTRVKFKNIFLACKSFFFQQKACQSLLRILLIIQIHHSLLVNKKTQYSSFPDSGVEAS